MNRTLPPPLEPLRPVVMKEFHEVGYTDRVATALSTGRDEKTARTGACVVHCIGTPRIDGPRFHDENIIYSHHFR